MTKEIAEAYASSINHGRLKASTYNKHLNLLTQVFRVVKHKAKLTASVWEDIQRKRIVANSRRELTVDELRIPCFVAIKDHSRNLLRQSPRRAVQEIGDPTFQFVKAFELIACWQ